MIQYNLIHYKILFITERISERAMFKYKNVMAAGFTMFFLATAAQMIYSIMVLPPHERIIILISGLVLYAVPVVIFISGKLKRLSPYILVTFYVISCFVMAIFNKNEIYLPILFSVATVFVSFFLSSKILLWYLALSDAALLALPIAFFPGGSIPYFVPVYIVVIICYNFAGLAMSLFVQTIQSSIVSLKRRNKKLSQSDRRKDLFWAASAGKMRQSADELSQICGALLERNDIPITVRKKLSEIQIGTGKLFMTLNDAEDYALAESRRMEIKKEPYRFDSLVKSMSAICAACPNENIDVLIDCQADIPSVLSGDIRRIAQIIMNLYENSVKNTESGTITVGFSSRKTKEGVNLQITVSDTGKGLSEEAEKRIFTVYSEEDGGKPAIHLGLGISKELINLMGGFIFVRGEKTGGTVFTLTVPQGIVSDTPFAAIEKPEALSALLYIKNTTVRDSAAAQLEKMGISCDSCMTKSEFMMKKDSPGITHIFCDYGFYLYDKPIFDIIAKRVRVIVISGAGKTGTPLPVNIKRISYPISMASFVRIFSDKGGGNIRLRRFTAPDAKVLIVRNKGSKFPDLKHYKIPYEECVPENVTDKLREDDYDLILLCDNPQGTAAKIMISDDGMYMHIPVIAFGGSGEGCSDTLSPDCTEEELEELLENYLPENTLCYNTSEETAYFSSFEGKGAQ